MILRVVPNTLTSLNLLCGCLGIALALSGPYLHLAAYMILIAAVFDFLDGMAARLLNAQSELGKQLDSLADVVSFGVLPGVILFQLITIGMYDFPIGLAERELSHILVAGVGFLLPVFSALRLARFNLDPNQTKDFVGLATPAMALLVAMFPLVLEWQYAFNVYYLAPQGELFDIVAERFHWSAFEISALQLFLNPNFYIYLTLVLCLLMVAPIRMFSFKFQGFSLVENKFRYLFILLLILLTIAVFIPYWGLDILPDNYPDIDFLILPVVIPLYILLSLVYHLTSIGPKR